MGLSPNTIENMVSGNTSIGEKVQGFVASHQKAFNAVASSPDAVAAPTAPPTIATPSTSGDANLNSLANSMLAKADRGFYGHMTIEKCYQMSRTKGELRSDKSSFAKSTCNGMNIGKKGK